MHYGKLKNGVPVYAENPIKLDEPITVNGVTHEGYLSTNEEAVLLQLGYKPIIYTPLDAEVGFDYNVRWEETETAIVRVWEAVPIPENADDPYEIIDVLTGEEV